MIHACVYVTEQADVCVSRKLDCTFTHFEQLAGF